MTIYTVEIAGRPIITISADDRDAAVDFTNEEWFRADLMALETREHEPLWDGKSELFVREAEEEERATWDKSIALAIAEVDGANREEALSKGYVVFLLPVVDPTDSIVEVNVADREEALDKGYVVFLLPVADPTDDV